MHPAVTEVTDRIVERSHASRAAYLQRISDARGNGDARRRRLPCGNQAHGLAAAEAGDKSTLRGGETANIGIVSAYTEMLSAHQPYARFPDVIKAAAREAGATAQFAGGVPAMCDGITQGQPGMEMSLFSRDVIAMSTALAMSHDLFDAALYLGVCDKIVPGLLIGALSFGHLPTVFVPAGPMPTGFSNQEKSRQRQLFAAGKLSRAELLEVECKAYHSPGTCTFYGTANSNQMLMEIMGLHLPGASFVNPRAPMRDTLTAAATRQVVAESCPPLAEIVDERTLVNGIVGLLATGGSTNHTLHLVAIARAAGIIVSWDDFADLSAVVPLLARVHPNGPGDINDFQAAGGTAFLIAQLLDGGFLHADVSTVLGRGLDRYRQEPVLTGSGKLEWRDGPVTALNDDVLRPVDQPFSPEGGIKVLGGNLGRAVIKVSAVKPEHRVIEAPVAVFEDQSDFMSAFECGELHRDVVIVLRFQGPRANGMPELHKLTPPLGVLQDLGYKVALVTDGRMSGASGKIPAAIHVSPEAAVGGPLARIRDGDIVRLDAESSSLEVLVDAAAWRQRQPATPDISAGTHGLGRELFSLMRASAGDAETGAMAILAAPDAP